MSELPRDPVVDGFYQDLASKSNSNYQAMLLVVFNALTAAKKGNYPTQDEMIEYAVLCQQTGLNPLVRSEIAPLCKNGRVSLIVQRDGWIKIARSRPGFNGITFNFSKETKTINVRIADGWEGKTRIFKTEERTVPLWIECTVWEKGVEHPITWRTPFEEAFVQDSDPWNKEPLNMLQVRAMARAIRNTYGVNCYTPEEATFIDIEPDEEKPPVAVVKKQQTAELPKSNTQAFLGRINSEHLQFEDKYSLNGNLEETREPIQAQQPQKQTRAQTIVQGDSKPRQRVTGVTRSTCASIRAGIDKAVNSGTLNQNFAAYQQQVEQADVTPQEKEDLKNYLQESSVKQGQAAGYGAMTGREGELNG